MKFLAYIYELCCTAGLDSLNNTVSVICTVCYALVSFTHCFPLVGVA